MEITANAVQTVAANQDVLFTNAAMFSYETNLTVEQEELLADLIATYGQEIISKTNDIFQRLKANKGDLSS